MIKNKIFLALITKKFIKPYQFRPLNQILELIDDDISYHYVHDDFNEEHFMLDDIHGTLLQEIVSYDIRFYIQDLNSDKYHKVIVNFEDDFNHPNDLSTIQAMATCYLSSHWAFMQDKTSKIQDIYQIYAYCDEHTFLDHSICQKATLHLSQKQFQTSFKSQLHLVIVGSN